MRSMVNEIADSDAESDFEDNALDNAQLGNPNTVEADEPTDTAWAPVFEEPTNIDFEQFISSSLSRPRSTNETLTTDNADIEISRSRNQYNRSNHIDLKFNTNSRQEYVEMTKHKRGHSMTQNSPQNFEADVQILDKRRRTLSPSRESSKKKTKNRVLIDLDEDSNNAEPRRSQQLKAPSTAFNDDHSSAHHLGHSISTSRASIGNFESINMDFRGSDQGLDIDANPFEKSSQASVSNDEHANNGEPLVILSQERGHGVTVESGIENAAGSDKNGELIHQESATATSQGDLVDNTSGDLYHEHAHPHEVFNSDFARKCAKEVRFGDGELDPSVINLQKADKSLFQQPQTQALTEATSDGRGKRKKKSKLNHEYEALSNDQPQRQSPDTRDPDSEMSTNLPQEVYNARPSKSRYKRVIKNDLEIVDELQTNSDQQNTDMEIIIEQEQNNIEKSSKKKRGRPRKNADTTVTKEVTVLDPTEQQSKLELEEGEPNVEKVRNVKKEQSTEGDQDEDIDPDPQDNETIEIKTRDDPEIPSNSHNPNTNAKAKKGGRKPKTQTEPPDTSDAGMIETQPMELNPKSTTDEVDTQIKTPKLEPTKSGALSSESKSKYRVGLSRRQPIPSLLRKVDKGRETTRIEKRNENEILQQQKLKKKKGAIEEVIDDGNGGDDERREKEKDKLLKLEELDDEEGENRKGINLRDEHGNLIEWND